MNVNTPEGVRLDAVRYETEYRGNRYIYPFIMRFSQVPEAVSYTLKIADHRGNKFEFVSEVPEVDLKPVWDKLSSGFIRYSGCVTFADGHTVNKPRVSTFYKAASFQVENTVTPKFPLSDSIEMHYRFLTQVKGDNPFDPELPDFIWHAVIDAETRQLYPYAYPASHNSYYIWALLDYASRRPDQAEEALRLAEVTAVQSVKFVTPDHFVWSGFPYSTIEGGKLGGHVETDGTVQPLKGALLCLGLLDLDRYLGQSNYTSFARHIGKLLKEHQLPSGAIPFRVNAETGDAYPEESTFIISAILLWEQLETFFPGEFKEARAKALAWLLEGPVETLKWIGNFEDIPNGVTDNFNHSDARIVAWYLLNHIEEHPEYLEKAKRIERWIEEGFVFYKPEYPFEHMNFICPQATEQCVYYYPIDSHLAEYARLQVKLYQVTGEQIYYDKAVASAYALTHNLTDRHEPLNMAPDPVLGGYNINSRVWFSCAADTFITFMQIERLIKSEGRMSETNNPARCIL